MRAVSNDSISALVERLLPSSRVPIDIEGIVRSLGISIVFSLQSDPSRVAEARKGVQNRYSIVLFRDSDEEKELSPAERFSLAHELGHILLDLRYGLQPKNRDQYWEAEEWCDSFAAELLIPQNAVPRNHISLPLQALAILNEVEERCRVSHEAAARRIAQFHSGITIFAGRIEGAENRKSDLWITWVAPSTPESLVTRNATVTQKTEIGRHLIESLSDSSDKITYLFNSPTLGRGIVRRIRRCWGLREDFIVCILK